TASPVLRSFPVTLRPFRPARPFRPLSKTQKTQQKASPAHFAHFFISPFFHLRSSALRQSQFLHLVTRKKIRFHAPARMKTPIFILLFLASLQTFAENWPLWRGPFGQGISDEKNLPIHWSKTENVKWRAPLPDRGNSTPIVWNKRVFLTQSIP